MSKPDPADGSLENILASIRKSLAEQSTDALSEAGAAEPDKGGKPSRKSGLTERLAGALVEPGTGRAAQSGGDDLSDLLDEPADKASPAAATGPAMTASGDNDPLWFLTRSDAPASDDKLPPLGAATEASSAASEPELTRPEVVRASMPPFFGSSETVPAPVADPASTRAGGAPAGRANATQPGASAQAAAEAAIAREVPLVAAAAEAAAATPVHAPPQPRPQTALNGSAAPASAPAPAPEALAGDTPLTRALETVVLDLLKPMLRQWLDENMPRLVAEALSEEVQRSRGVSGDPKKT